MNSYNNDLDNFHEMERSLFEMRYKMQKSRSLDRILKLYSILGILISVLGGVYFTLITLKIELSFQQQISLIAIGTGITLSVLSRFLLTLKAERLEDEIIRLREIQSSSEFIMKWSKFENLAKEKLLSHKDKFNVRSIRDVISLLVSNRMITDKDGLFLDEAIRLRNTILHTGTNVPRSIISDYLRQLDTILLKIKDI